MFVLQRLHFLSSFSVCRSANEQRAAAQKKLVKEKRTVDLIAAIQIKTPLFGSVKVEEVGRRRFRGTRHLQNKSRHSGEQRQVSGVAAGR